MSEQVERIAPSGNTIAANSFAINRIKRMIAALIHVEEEEDGSLTGFYMDFFLQVSFSPLHPLMILSLSKPFYLPLNINLYRALNRVNLHCVLGSHTVSDEVGCYSFRLTHWILSSLTEQQFQQMLERSLSEAQKGFSALCPDPKKEGKS